MTLPRHLFAHAVRQRVLLNAKPPAALRHSSGFVVTRPPPPDAPPPPPTVPPKLPPLPPLPTSTLLEAITSSSSDPHPAPPVAYASLRATDPDALARLHLDDLSRLVHLRTRLAPGVIPFVAKDLVQGRLLPDAAEGKGRRELARELLARAVRDESMLLDRETFLDLVELGYGREGEGDRPLDPTLVEPFIEELLASSPTPRLFGLLAAHLSANLESLSAYSDEVFPVPAFRLFPWLLAHPDGGQYALQLFTALSQQGYIPEGATSSSSSSSGEADSPRAFHCLILTSCVRAALASSETVLACELLASLPPNIDHYPTDLLRDVASHLLTNNSTPTLSALVDLLSAYPASQPSAPLLPSDLLTRTYRVLTDAGLVHLLSTLYHALPPELYGPPPPNAFVALLRHLARTASRQQVRALARHALQQGPDAVPSAYRPLVVSLLASAGVGFEAREFYDLFSASPSSDATELFLGNTRMLLDIVRYFTRPSSPTPHGRSPEEIAADHAFAARALDIYLATKPTLDLPHTHLTSLARACLALGNLPGALSIFRHMLTQRIVPDRADVNVVLLGIADQSPRAAARLFDGALKRGFVPDSTTYGTLVARALEIGDEELAREFMRDAALRKVRLSGEGMVALFRFAISSGRDVMVSLKDAFHTGRVKPSVDLLRRALDAALHRSASTKEIMGLVELCAAQQCLDDRARRHALAVVKNRGREGAGCVDRLLGLPPVLSTRTTLDAFWWAYVERKDEAGARRVRVMYGREKAEEGEPDWEAAKERRVREEVRERGRAWWVDWREADMATRGIE